MSMPSCESRYVEQARLIFAARFPIGCFDDSSWDIRHLRSSQHKRTNSRVYFTRYGSTTDALSARFAHVVKAFLLLMNASGGTMPLRVDAARMLWRAVEKRRRDARFSWSDLSEEDLLEAEQEMLHLWGTAATYKRCTMLQRMVDMLAAAPCGAIVPPIKATFRTPRQEDFERYTLEGQHLRQAKMPADDAIVAIGRMFSALVSNQRERLVLCALALLLATGFRVGEVLTLPLDCEVTDGTGVDQKYGLRYYKEKSRGGEKRFAVHWLTAAQAELAKAAIAEVKSLTKPARTRALVLEQHPDTVPLPGIAMTKLLTTDQVANLIGYTRQSVNTISVSKLPRQRSESISGHLYRGSDVMSYLFALRKPLWVIDRKNGTHQLLSESLFIQFRDAGHAAKGMNPLLVESLSEQAVNDFLGGRIGKGRTIMKSAFERYNIRDTKGEPYKMHSHQFRHWVTTKAAQAGVPDHLIARWQGREHIGDLEAYKHITPGDRLETLKAALKAGRVKGQIADMYFSLKDDVRDVFLEGQLQAVHVTPLGLCVHDFKVTPCPKFLNCVKDCEDYVLDTSNKAHITNLVQLRTRTELILDQARQQKARGEQDHSDSWIAEAEATLNGVERILHAASTESQGIVRPFEGKGTQFQRANETDA
jgi:integrase